IIPKTFFDAFTGSGDLLQVLLLAILCGYAMNRMGEKSRPVHQFVESASQILFAMVNVIMKLAPLAAGGAMAITIRNYGVHALAPLAQVMGAFYLTCILFVIVVLGTIAKLVGFSIFCFLKLILDEVLTVLGTSASETVVVPLMVKLKKMGCSKSVVDLVVP